MLARKSGDRIEHWLLSDDSPFARQMRGGRAQEWDPDSEFEGDPEGRAAWDADPLGVFGTKWLKPGTRCGSCPR